MGWSERDWYLGPHRAQVFDTAGNGGATIWVDGRIVGGWSTKDGAVDLVLLEDVGADARAALDTEADRLTAWLHGTSVMPRFPAPLVSPVSPASIACWMRSATSSGWLIIATCEESISTVVAPARSAMIRSAAGSMTRSCEATM